MVDREAWREDKRKLKDNIKVDFNINRTYGRGLISLSYCGIFWTEDWTFWVYKNGECVKQLSSYLLIKNDVPHLTEWIMKIRYNMMIMRNVLFYKDTTTTTLQLKLNSPRWHILNRWQHWNRKFFVFPLFSAGFPFSGHISATNKTMLSIPLLIPSAFTRTLWAVYNHSCVVEGKNRQYLFLVSPSTFAGWCRVN